jgi:hypothetical protein
MEGSLDLNSCSSWLGEYPHESRGDIAKHRRSPSTTKIAGPTGVTTRLLMFHYLGRVRERSENESLLLSAVDICQ